MVLDLLSSLDDDTCVFIIGELLQSKPELAPGLVTFACPELTYAPARAVTQRRCNGVVLTVSSKNDMSFIRCPELRTVFECDVCVAPEHIRGFKEGQRVSFAVTLNDQSEPQGIDLQTDPPSAPSFMSRSMGEPGPMPALPTSPVSPGPVAGSAATPAAGTGVVVPRRVYATKGGTVRMEEYSGAAKDASGPDAAKDPIATEELGEYYGFVKAYDAQKGFGFIMCKPLKDYYYSDVYVHGDGCANFPVGSEVKFEAYLYKGKLQGREVQDATGQVGSAGGLPEELGIFIGEFKVFNFERGFGFINCDQLRVQGYPGDASGWPLWGLASRHSKLQGSRIGG